MLKFRIDVLEVEVDQKPELKFWADVEEQCLNVRLRDDGWGSSRPYNVEVGEAHLNQLFPQPLRTFLGSIAGGDEQKIIGLSIEDADMREFGAMLQLQRSELEKQLQGYSPFPDAPDTLIIGCYGRWYVSIADKARPHEWPPGILAARWNCLEDDFSGEYDIRHGYTEIGVSHDGFVQSYPRIAYGANFSSDTVYAAIVDPSMGPHQREYSISRRIPSGDVDRFHILIGATMSCKMKVNVDFFLDDDTVIRGREVLALTIWNPRNKSYHNRYKDGEEVHR
jgi:hypothetical protein